MKKSKIGSLFLISVLAIAGLGISYAGFSDQVAVVGVVETGTVDIEVVEYSCTEVWKIFNVHEAAEPPVYPGLSVNIEDEIAIYYGPCLTDEEFETVEALLDDYADVIFVAGADAFEGVDENEVIMFFDNLFPCIDFKADVIIHYAGTIPAHVTVGDLVWDDEGFDFGPYTTFTAYSYTLVEGVFIRGDPIQFPVQMHYCEYVGIEVTIHIAQDNLLQGLFGEFSFDINALQWNEVDDS